MLGLQHHVCRLKQALYGLKQAARAWFERFSTCVLNMGFEQSDRDLALFTMHTREGSVFLLLYVDDMIITSSNKYGIHYLKHFLQQQFEVKDLGFLHYFLGIEMAYSPEGYLPSQKKYCNEVIQRTSISDTKSFTTPIEPDLKMRTDDEVPLSDLTRYRQVAGSLFYLTITRPNNAYAVHVVSQFVACPTLVHWFTVLCILCYL